MSSDRFAATLLRQSAGGLAGLAAGRLLEDGTGADRNGSFAAWQGQFRSVLLELAAAVEDGARTQFRERVGWIRDAFLARGYETDVLAQAFRELGVVMSESLPEDAWRLVEPTYAPAVDGLDRDRPESAPAEGEGPHDALVTEYVAALRAGDSQRAFGTVLDAIEDGRVSVDEALESLLTKALREVGRLWHENEISVGMEHFATFTTGRLLERILLLPNEVQPIDATVVLTMVEGDVHDLGLRIVAGFFERAGWRTICLGGNTPIEDVVWAADEFDASLIVLGATLNTHRERVAKTIERIREADAKRPLIIGGPAFLGLADSAQELGANGCAGSAREALALATSLLSDS